MFSPLFSEMVTIISVACLVCLVGIPHGATDHILFSSITKNPGGLIKWDMIKFYVAYLGLIGIYIFLWYLFPAISLIIFLLASFYHFGQENLKNIQWKSSAVKYSSIIISGTFVLATPLLNDMETTWPIVKSIIRSESDLIFSTSTFKLIGYCIIAIYGIYLSSLIIFNHVNKASGLHELINWFILSLLFLTTPLLIGFAVYFSLWHSLPSILEQVRFLRKNKPLYNLRKHLMKTAPYTIISLAGLGLGLLLLKDDTLSEKLATGFICLSVITLPHIILMDRFHEISCEESVENHIAAS
jgi:Brp/Blh family beta-carotene 15,15'-monooxygenase